MCESLDKHATTILNYELSQTWAWQGKNYRYLINY